jgi:hypothetical protein
MLVGVRTSNGDSVLAAARFALGCLARSVHQRLLTQASIMAVTLALRALMAIYVYRSVGFDVSGFAMADLVHQRLVTQAGIVPMSSVLLTVMVKDVRPLCWVCLPRAAGGAHDRTAVLDLL